MFIYSNGKFPFEKSTKNDLSDNQQEGAQDGDGQTDSNSNQQEGAQENETADQTQTTNVSENFCQENENQFTEYSSFFENKNYLTWCEECLDGNGIPMISQISGPFCNKRTTDSGNVCTNSEQCEGYCLAESRTSTSGKCAEFEKLSDGCGHFEFFEGLVAELCIV